MERWNDADLIRRTEQRQAVAELFRMGLAFRPTALDILANESKDREEQIMRPEQIIIASFALFGFPRKP